MRRMVPHVPAPVRFLMYLRFSRYLLWEFRWPLSIFTSLVLVGGLILHLFYDHGRLPFAHACHAGFLMFFLELLGSTFPPEWYLQPLFFLLPIIGLGAVADSVVRLAYLVFTCKQNLPEWNRMLAALCRNHFVVIGVGKVGYQVIRHLLELRESVVAIEMASGSPLLGELFDKGVPVIQGNARQSLVLEQAGVRQARAVIVTTSDDLTNLDAAITARELNRDAKIVLRLFDETLAIKVAGAFSMPTISTSQVAAPAFIAAATGRKICQGFRLAGQVRSLHRPHNLPDQPAGRIERGRNPGRQAHQYRHASRRAGRERQPRPGHCVGTGRYDFGHRPDGGLAHARVDEPGASVRRSCQQPGQGGERGPGGWSGWPAVERGGTDVIRRRK